MSKPEIEWAIEQHGMNGSHNLDTTRDLVEATYHDGYKTAEARLHAAERERDQAHAEEKRHRRQLLAAQGAILDTGDIVQTEDLEHDIRELTRSRDEARAENARLRDETARAAYLERKLVRIKELYEHKPHLVAWAAESMYNRACEALDGKEYAAALESEGGDND